MHANCCVHNHLMASNFIPLLPLFVGVSGVGVAGWGWMCRTLDTCGWTGKATAIANVTALESLARYAYTCVKEM